MTNFDIFNISNSILRKEINGSALTPDRFNYYLNLSYIEKLENEYDNFEKDQRNTDALIKLKQNETVNFDAYGEYDLSSLTYNYWHLDNIFYYYNSSYIHVDIVNNIQYVSRLSSSLEYPTLEYPIVRISDDKLKMFPYPYVTSTINLVTNSGATGTTDWVDSNADGIADGWSLSGGLVGNIVSGYGFEGNSQGMSHNYSGGGAPEYSSQYYVSFTYTGTSDIMKIGKRYKISFKARVYSVDSNYTGDTTLTIYGINSNSTLYTFSNYDNPTTVQSYSCIIEIKDYDESFIIVSYNTTQNEYKYVFIDEVVVNEVTDLLDINILYLKEKTTPYMDWYYDANDNINYLTEGEVYTLQTGEQYIDKDNGSILISGAVIGTSSDDAVNHTVEMEIPDDHKKDVLYHILSKLGVQMTNQLATQYSLSMEAKEQTK